MAIARLDDGAIEQRLQQRPAWALREGKLYRRLQFADFNEAFGFMTRVALLAERANHHPEWSNVWRTVEISLTTHEAGGISERDFALAEQIDGLLQA